MMIREMKKEDWGSVASIYRQGISTNTATFQTDVPEWDYWDNSHLQTGRLVAVNEMNQNDVLGWIALSPTSSRCAYKGVVEVSIYVREDVRGKKIASSLMQKLIETTEKENIWTLQSTIISLNQASIALHKKNGFRIVGTRERISKDINGIWQDTILMERRSQIVGI